MIFPKIWCSIRRRYPVDVLFSVQYLAAVNIGTLFLNEERVAKSKKEFGGGDSGDGDGTYVCNPGTASWEMVRKTQTCIPGHVLSQARLTYTYTLAQRLIARIPRIDLVHNHQFRIFLRMCDICNTTGARSWKILRLKLTTFIRETIVSFNFTALRTLWKNVSFMFREY